MATLTPNPKMQFFDANGNPLVGGKLYTYAAGTNTPLATYTDAGGATPNANPVILDSRGEANVWLGVTQYKFTLKDSLDNLIWTVDNLNQVDAVTLARLAQSDGSSLVGFLQSGTGAVATTVQSKLRQTVNVKDFGAVGNGITNDTAAFSSAIATGKNVFVPAGTYAVNLTITSRGTHIIGEGPTITTLVPSVTTSPVIKIDGDAAGTFVQFCQIEELSISGVSRLGHGIHIYNTSDVRGCDYIRLINLYVSNCNYGLYCQGRSIWNYFENCLFDFNIDGIHVETDQAINSWTLVNCTTNRNNRHGCYLYKTDVSISGMIGFGFYNFNSEYNGQDVAQAVSYGVYLNGAQGVCFYDLTLENNGYTLTSQEGYGLYVTGTLGRGVAVDGCWAVNSKHPIKIDGQKKSGSINNVHTLVPVYGGVGLEIAANWANDEPKIEIGPVINGTITNTYDVNGAYATVKGVDWVPGSPTTINFANRKSITYQTSGGAGNINTANGLLPGDEINIFNYAGGTANTVTLAAGLMATGVAYSISANVAQKFLVLGFPAVGKLIPL